MAKFNSRYYFLRFVALLLPVLALAACSTTKHYSKNDYSFYDPNFITSAQSLVLTNGIYVLDKIWTNKNGGETHTSNTSEFYKFYEKGQVNKVLDPTKQLKSTADHVAALNQHITKTSSQKTATLFEGYYRLKTDSIIIQQVATPRRQFVYTYGYIKKDSLIIVSQTHTGNGGFTGNNFTPYYKAFYRFVPTGNANYSQPNW